MRMGSIAHLCDSAQTHYTHCMMPEKKTCEAANTTGNPHTFDVCDQYRSSKVEKLNNPLLTIIP